MMKMASAHDTESETFSSQLPNVALLPAKTDKCKLRAADKQQRCEQEEQVSAKNSQENRLSQQNRTA